MIRRTKLSLICIVLGVFLITIPAWKQINEVHAMLNEKAEVEVIIPTRYIPVTNTEYIYIKEETPFGIVDLGEFEVTYYTAGYESTGKIQGHSAYGITKSGARVREGVTIAVDPTEIQLGSYLYIEGIGFGVAQDTGGLIKGKKIDVFVEDITQAIQGGVSKHKVYKVE